MFEPSRHNNNHCRRGRRGFSRPNQNRTIIAGGAGAVSLPTTITAGGAGAVMIEFECSCSTVHVRAIAAGRSEPMRARPYGGTAHDDGNGDSD